MPAGRPSLYTDAVAMEICTRMADGESLRRICEDAHMPDRTTIHWWLAAGKHPEFVHQYACAREAQADHYAEEIVQISDDGANDTYMTDNGRATNQDVIARSRLRVDARKWYASKLAPKKYGDKLELAGEVAVKRSAADLTDDELSAIATGRLSKNLARSTEPVERILPDAVG